MERPIFIGMKVSPKEYEILKENSQKASRPLSTYIRETSLGKTLHERPQEEFLFALMNLKKIGINLNQIATRVNTYKYLDEKQLQNIIIELDQFIKDCKKKYIGSG